MSLPDDLQNLSVHGPDWFKAAMSQPRKEGIVEVDDCPVHYFEWGDPNKRGVLLAHGFLAHARCFAFIAPLLADDFHLVAYDLSGMGDSGSRDSYSDTTRIHEMVAVAEETGLTSDSRPPFIATHSYGSSVGIGAVTQNPTIFGGIVVCDFMMLRPSIMRDYMGARQERGMPSGGKPNKVYPDLETALGRYRLAPPQSCDNDYLLHYMAYHSLKQVEGGWSWKFDPGILSSDTREIDWWAEQPIRFAGLPARKAIIHGEQSTLFTRDSAEYIRELTDGPVPIIAIPNAQHHLMLRSAYCVCIDVEDCSCPLGRARWAVRRLGLAVFGKWAFFDPLRDLFKEQVELNGFCQIVVHAGV